jgi:D-beta-D-heptose 7-phosphate kinase / D-beta-D-heptose 1-phosphate adenosyltransferase
MNHDVAQLVHRFSGLHAVVVGEAMLDRYSTGYSQRICPEGPVPIVDTCSTANYAGAAANTAVNLRALGARVSLVSAIGEDAEGAALLDLLRQREIELDHVCVSPARATLAKHRVHSENQILLRFDHGTTTPITKPIEQRLIQSLRSAQAAADLIVVSDYDYGIVTDAVIDFLNRDRGSRPPILAVDSKRLRAFSRLDATLMKPNFAQALELLGLKANPAMDRPKQVLEHGIELLRRSRSKIVAVTLDDEGAVVLQCGAAPHRTTTQPAPNCQAAGAGDTYLSAFGLALAAGAATSAAADMAAAAAKVVVSRRHTAVCTVDELLAALGGLTRPGDLDGLALQIERHRRVGRRIVLTGGCFDILHRGHVTYLERAKSLGDVLVVGVNSDESIRRLKGADRPINSLEDRLGVLAGLSCIDHLATFEELTPERLIRVVRPDVFVKGGDYTRKTLPEASVVEELGGRIVLLPYLMDHSTSRIVERIRDAGMPPARIPIDANGNGHASHHAKTNGEHSNGVRELVRRTQRFVR